MNNISFWLSHCHECNPYSLLTKYGYDHDWLKLGDIGGLRARTSGKYFEPDEKGSLMITQAIWADQPSLYNFVEDPIIFDIIAWNIENPNKWYYLRGETGLILGDKALFMASIFNDDLYVFQNPLKWLKSGCKGVVLLDDLAHVRLYGLKNVVCENVKHGNYVEQKLLSPYLRNMPNLSVPAQEGDHHA